MPTSDDVPGGSVLHPAEAFARACAMAAAQDAVPARANRGSAGVLARGTRTAIPGAEKPLAVAPSPDFTTRNETREAAP